MNRLKPHNKLYLVNTVINEVGFEYCSMQQYRRTIEAMGKPSSMALVADFIDINLDE